MKKGKKKNEKKNICVICGKEYDLEKSQNIGMCDKCFKELNNDFNSDWKK
ncbi:hypothetical protein ES703_10945 [subsurface metagenome]